MRVRSLVTLVLSMALAVQFLGPAAALAADPLSYDDPGMHFRAPDGWERLDILETEAAGGSDGAARTVAAYALGKNKREARVILLTIQPFIGSLDGADRSHESELHSQSDKAFVDRREQTKLANGMPAYWLRISIANDKSGQFQRRYEYVVYDGKRSIILSLVGRSGDFDEKDAKAALASLYVVAYPRGR